MSTFQSRKTVNCREKNLIRRLLFSQRCGNFWGFLTRILLISIILGLGKYSLFVVLEAVRMTFFFILFVLGLENTLLVNLVSFSIILGTV